MANEQPEDPRITELLARLGNKTAEYPPELLAGRRASFDQKLSTIGIGLAVGGAAKAGLLKGAWTTESILKALIVTLMVAETVGGVMVYRQRQLRNTLPLNPTVTMTVSSPTFTPTLTATATETASPTPIITITPKIKDDDPGKHLGQTPTPPGKRPMGPKP